MVFNAGIGDIGAKSCWQNELHMTYKQNLDMKHYKGFLVDGCKGLDVIIYIQPTTADGMTLPTFTEYENITKDVSQQMEQNVYFNLKRQIWSPVSFFCFSVKVLLFQRSEVT